MTLTLIVYLTSEIFEIRTILIHQQVGAIPRKLIVGLGRMYNIPNPNPNPKPIPNPNYREYHIP